MAAPVDGSNDGTHAVTYRVVDGAGNVSSSASVDVKIDVTPPVTTVHDVDDEWHEWGLAHPVTATDALSGVSRIEYRIDGGPWLAPDPESGIQVFADGDHLVEYRAADAAGNVEAIRTCRLKIDQTGPSVVLDGDIGGWVNHPATVHAVVTDALSGPHPPYFSFLLDGTRQSYGSDTLTVETEGDHLVTFEGADAVGNITSMTVHAKVDLTPPTTTWGSPLVPSDALSGVDYTEWKLDKPAWTGPQASGTTQNLRGVACVDSANAWAFGASGTIRHTTDGGGTWVGQTSGVTKDLRQACFLDAQNGWVATNGGGVLHTGDGGAHWTAQTVGIANNLSLEDVCFVDAATGWVVGASGTILHTTNGGASWTPQTSGTTQTLDGIDFSSATRGHVVGFGGTILSTTNGGTTWTAQTSGTTNRLVGVVIDDAQPDQAWATGVSGTMLRTENGGATWVAQDGGMELLRPVRRRLPRGHPLDRGTVPGRERELRHLVQRRVKRRNTLLRIRVGHACLRHRSRSRRLFRLDGRRRRRDHPHRLRDAALAARRGHTPAHGLLVLLAIHRQGGQRRAREVPLHLAAELTGRPPGHRQDGRGCGCTPAHPVFWSPPPALGLISRGSL